MPVIDLASLPSSRVKPRPVANKFHIGRVAVPANVPFLLRPRIDERDTCLVYIEATAGTIRYRRDEEQPTLNQMMQESFPIRYDRAIEFSGPNPIWVISPVATVVCYDDGVG